MIVICSCFYFDVMQFYVKLIYIVVFHLVIWLLIADLKK